MREFFIGLTLSLLIFSSTQAEKIPHRASVNVPLRHWTYEALEHLVSRGTIPAGMIDQKPLTREQVARILSEASMSQSQQEDPSPYLEMLKKEYAYEFLQFQEEAQLQGILKRPGVQFHPVDPLRIEPSVAAVEDKEGTTRDNHQGDPLKDGVNFQADLRSTLLLNPFLALEATPKILSQEGDTDLFYERFYSQFVWKNFNFEVGRDSIWWGPGYHGSLLFTDNAPPFDLIKLGSAQPFHLPWFLRHLGYFHVSNFLTELENNRVIAHPKLYGFQLQWMPFTFLNLSLNRAIMFGGKGRPELDFGEFLDAVGGFNENPPGEGTDPATNTNQLASINTVLTLPWLSEFLPLVDGIKFYWEYGGEDEIHQNILPGVEIPTLGGTANILGLFLSFGPADLRVEYMDNSDDILTWYAHSAYQSGYTYKGSIIGHHAGGDAEDLFIRASTLLGEKWRVGLQYDWERHGVEHATVVETKKEWGGDATFFYSDNILLQGSYEWEQIENKENVSGEEETNQYFILELQTRF
ncbi:MAG: hypothetical protein HY538_02520 [Deltaproteobacteria bacterium]|nr:hypothetical protein [Deltaproteobacteria bacterium]